MARSAMTVHRFTYLVALSLASLPAMAQDCPTSVTAKAGFALERAGTRTEVWPESDLFVRVTNSYPNGKKQDGLYFKGLLVMTRSEPSVQTVTFPLSDWRTIFPLDVGVRRTLTYVPIESGKPGRLTSLELTVPGRDKLQLGPCSYDVLIIHNRFLAADGKVLSEHSDLYSVELGFILAKRYDERGGRQTTVKYETIRLLDRGAPR